MTAKWTETTETTVPARVELAETECELWTRRRSAYRCVTEPATPTEIGRGLQALEPAERAEALGAAGVEPTPPATPEEIGEVLAGLEPDERGRALDAAGVPSATPEELAAVVAALPPDDRLRVLRALGAKPTPARTPEALGAELAALDCCEFLRAARAAGIVEARRVPAPALSIAGRPLAWTTIEIRSDGNGPDVWPTFQNAEAVAKERAQLRAERDRAQLEAAAVAQRLEDTTRILKRVQGERDQAQANARNVITAAEYRLRVTAAERDAARAESATLRQGRDAAVAQIATELARVRELAAERDQARAELAALREALNQPAHSVGTVDQPGPAACVVTDDTGEQAEVRRGGPVGTGAGLVRVNGGAWIWLSSILLAAHRAGVLP